MPLTQIECTSHEALFRIDEAAVGLTGFIALHSTQLGPAAGGLRMHPYDSTADALQDVLRLSQGMTYKNAAADLPLGGGKAVIIGDPKTQKTPELLQAFGAAIQSLNGQYWTAEDMGMTPSDMAELAKRTDFVAGLTTGEYASGDPSPITAQGIFNAIRIAAKHRYGSKDLNGKTVAVQGLGNVGRHLCHLLHQAGARLIVTDIDAGQMDRVTGLFAAASTQPDQIYSAPADIFAPCAIGAVLNTQTIAQLTVDIVAGGANNQLATPEDATKLHQRGILYAPDYVANGGGIINVATEILRIKDTGPWVDSKLSALQATMDAILRQAIAQNISPALVADNTVQARMARTAA